MCKQGGGTSFKPVSLVLKGMIDKAKVKGCSAGDQCDKAESKMTYEELVRHLRNECKLVSVACTKCGLNMLRGEATEHFASCEGADLACEQCGLTGKQKTLQAHLTCVQKLKS